MLVSCCSFSSQILLLSESKAALTCQSNITSKVTCCELSFNTMSSRGRESGPGGIPILDLAGMPVVTFRG